MTGWTTPLRTGLAVSFDGEQFTIAEIEGTRMMLRRAGMADTSSCRQVDLIALLSHPSTRILVMAPEPQPAVGTLLGGLDNDEDDELTVRRRHVQEVRTGYQHGCAELALDGEPRPPRDSGITWEWLEREYVVMLRSIETLPCERDVTAPCLISLAKNWGLPVRHHSQFSGIGQLDLPAPLSPAMRAVTMRKGALRRLELITQIPSYASIATAARAFYDGRESVLVQRVQQIEAAVEFTIIDRSTTPLTPTPQDTSSSAKRSRFSGPPGSTKQIRPTRPQ